MLLAAILLHSIKLICFVFPLTEFQWGPGNFCLRCFCLSLKKMQFGPNEVLAAGASLELENNHQSSLQLLKSIHDWKSPAA